MIDVTNVEEIRRIRPFLVAHRGGVITRDAPENSLRAIELAAEHGYSMAELDVREAADHEPVLMHDPLPINCGVDGRVSDYTSADLVALRYRASEERVITLAQAMERCAALGLGVMLDFKLEREAGSGDWVDFSEVCLRRVASLIQANGLGTATVSISDTAALRQHLGRVALFPLRRATEGAGARMQVAGTPAWNFEPGKGEFWFDWAEAISDEGIERLHERGVLLIVSINTFHYPKHAHRDLARRDIERLIAAGMDGFQIDSVYEDFFPGHGGGSADRGGLGGCRLVPGV